MMYLKEEFAALLFNPQFSLRTHYLKLVPVLPSRNAHQIIKKVALFLINRVAIAYLEELLLKALPASILVMRESAPFKLGPAFDTC
jgi:hypothetical protein